MSPLPGSAVPLRGRRWPMVVGVVVALLAIAVIGASVITVPYYGVAPGEARPSEDRVSVDGHRDLPGRRRGPLCHRERAPPDRPGRVPRVARSRHRRGARRPDPRRSDAAAEPRGEPRARWAPSKDTATYVALEQLGFPVELHGGGAVVAEPVAEAPAAQFLQKDDVITEVDGVPIHLTDDIGPALDGKQEGDVVSVTVDRLNVDEPLTFDIPLWRNPEDGRVILGFTPLGAVPNTLEFTFPFPVEIDSGSVGGPSAGLAFTLALARHADARRAHRRRGRGGDRRDLSRRQCRADRRHQAEDRCRRRHRCDPVPGA